MDGTLYQSFIAMDGWQGLTIATKFTIYASCFIAGGGMFFRALFFPGLPLRDQQMLGRTIVGAAVIGMLSSIFHLTVINSTLGGGWADAVDINITKVVLATGDGPSIGLRLAGLFLIALSGRAKGRIWSLTALSGALLAVMSLGVAGHAAELATDTGIRPLLLIGIHLLAIAFWLGALWPLHRLTYAKDITQIAKVMHRFGNIAVIVVGALVVAGSLLLFLLLGRVEALWKVAYGQMMLIKLVSVAVLLLFAAGNKLYLTPRLIADDVTAIPVLRRVIRMEIVLVSVILLLTATLTTLVGPPILQ